MEAGVDLLSPLVIYIAATYLALTYLYHFTPWLIPYNEINTLSISNVQYIYIRNRLLISDTQSYVLSLFICYLYRKVVSKL